jgi:hypothetical protein
MSSTPVRGSFRDPSGFVFSHEGELFRQVNRAYERHYRQLNDSGLYAALVERHLLIPHKEVDSALALTADAHVVIQPERVPFISYPYEWCFSQLKAAALLTLDIQRLALGHGMILKDASAYNVQFLDSRPVFIDTLSFEVREEGRPWIAYRQFCQHFLAPLTLMAMVDVRLGSLQAAHLDGIPLTLADALLPTMAKLRPSLQIHLHQHAKAMRRHEATDLAARAPTVSLKAVEGLVESLAAAINKLDWVPESHWSHYYEGDSYTDEAFEAKQMVVKQVIDEAAPISVWDLGANTGAFSAMAAEQGAQTIAFEQDPAAVELHYRNIRRDGRRRILPLVLDLTNPSPGLGWGNTERTSMADRGPADLVLALALIHHLAIGNNVPLPAIAEQLVAMGELLIIEFVPKSDPKTQVLLRSREDVFPNYTLEGFETDFAPHFTIERREELPASDRTLFVLRRR